MDKKEIFIYWIDKYIGGYRAGVSHASKDGLITLCKRNMKTMVWDGGYINIEEAAVECKNCQKVINSTFLKTV